MITPEKPLQQTSWFSLSLLGDLYVFVLLLLQRIYKNGRAHSNEIQQRRLVAKIKEQRTFSSLFPRTSGLQEIS